MSRRGLIPALTFVTLGAVAFAVVVHLAGGVTLRSSDDDPVKPVDVGEDTGYSSVVPGGIEIGRTRSGHVERRATAVVDGNVAPYIAWELRFDSSEHRDHPEPDVRSEALTDASIWFYPRPTPEEPAPRATEGPRTSRVDAKTAHVTWRESGVDSLSARLTDDVVLTWFLDEDPDGRRGVFPDQAPDRALLRSDELLLATEAASGETGSDVRTVSSDQAVRFEAPGAIIDGTGLDGLLDGALEDAGPLEAGSVRMTLRSDVLARFLSKDGLLTGGNRSQDAEPVEVRIRCAGACEILKSTEEDSFGLPVTRWRITFHDDVVVDQGDAQTLTCDRLHLDYRFASGAEGDFGRVIAEGSFESVGSSDDQALVMKADRAEFWRDQEGVRHGLLERNVHIETESLLRATQNDGSAARRDGRLVVDCAGRAELVSKPRTDRPEWMRTVVKLYDDVVVRAEPAVKTRPVVTLRAPEVSLTGNEVADGDSTRFDPETLNARGGVTIDYGDDVRATSLVATWSRVVRPGRDAFLLGGDPVVRMTETGTLNPIGEAATAEEGLWVLSADDLELWSERAATGPDGTPGPDGEIEFVARGNGVLRKQVGETEPLVLRSDLLQARGRDNKLETVVATGKAELEGVAEDGSGKRGYLAGHRISLIGEAAAGDDPEARKLVGATVTELGTERAIARITTVGKDGPSQHEVLAPLIQYLDGGSLLQASRGAEARIQYDPRASALDRLVIRGQTLEARVVPEAPERPAELLSIVAERQVRMEGKGVTVTADTVEYDHRTSSAVANGSPAKIASPAALGTASSTAREDYVRSPTIRVWFDPTSETTDDRLRRATCQGGRIQFWQPGEDDTLYRVVASASGPIVMERDLMSARDDVDVRYELAQSNGGFELAARLRADAIEVQLDPDHDGSELRSAWRRLVATSRGQTLVRVTGKGMEASAYRVVNEGPMLHLSGGGGQRVWARRDTPREALFCQSLSVNLDTWEWTDFVAPEYITE